MILSTLYLKISGLATLIYKWSVLLSKKSISLKNGIFEM